MNNEIFEQIFSDYKFCLPLCAVATYAFLKYQSTLTENKSAKSVFNNTFLIRNSIFVALLAFLIIYFNQPQQGFHEFMKVEPANFF